jgi:hypothetical protein
LRIRDFAAELAKEFGAEVAEKVIAQLTTKHRGAEIPAKYRPTKQCLGEFEVAPKNAPTSKYCKVCARFAKRWLSALKANARYKSDPTTAYERALKKRVERRMAAGRPIRRIGSTQPCEYRDNGERTVGCEIDYVLKGSAQKFCPPCRKRADARSSAVWRAENPDKEKQHSTDRWIKTKARLATADKNAAEIVRIEEEIKMERSRANARVADLEGQLAALQPKAAVGEKFSHKSGPGRKKLAPEKKREYEIGKKVEDAIPRAKRAMEAKSELPARFPLSSLRAKLDPLGYSTSEVEMVYTATNATQLAILCVEASRAYLKRKSTTPLAYDTIARLHRRYLALRESHRHTSN